MSKRPKQASDVERIVRTSYDDDNLLEAQLEPIGMPSEGTGSALPVDLVHPYGFQGRPNDADVDPSGNISGGCPAQSYSEGYGKEAMATEDARVTATLPALPKGGSRQYDASGARAELDGKGNYGITLPVGSTLTIDVGGGIQVVISQLGVQIKGVSTKAPVLVGDKAVSNPANAVLCGSPAAPSQVPSTVLYAAIV